MSEHTLKAVQTQEEFNEELMFKSVRSVPFLKAVKQEVDFSFRSIFFSLFPIFTWLPQYNCKSDILCDVLSGFTVAVMHVPQGMAYAALGVVNPIVGIYMAVFPTLPYVIMGTSKHISLGTFSITCIMAARPVMDYSGKVNFTDSSVHNGGKHYEYSPLEVASVLSFCVGIFQVMLGLLSAGNLSVFLSGPIICAFTSGAAVLVLISQLPHVLGIAVDQHFGPLSAVQNVFELVGKISETNIFALTMSLVVIICLLVCSECLEPRLKWKFKFPIELVVMIFGVCMSHSFDLKTRYNVNVVGKIPTGIPSPKFPKLHLMVIPHFLFQCISIAIVCYAISISMATTFATKDNYKINYNQELFAYGLGNLFGGFFPCLPMSASLTRSAIQYSTGGKTQLVTIFSSIFLIFTLVLICQFFDSLPLCILAGIVIKSLKGLLLQVTQLPTFWRLSSTDGVLWVIVFGSVIFIDMISGLGVAFTLAVISIVLMNQKTYVCLLGRVPNSNLFLEMRRYEAAQPVSGMMFVQIHAGLHFANINVCINRIDYLLKKTLKTENVNIVILVFSAVLFMDPEAIDCLYIYITQLNSKGIEVYLAECTGRVYEQMSRSKFFDKFSENKVFPFVQQAVAFYQEMNKKTLLVQETTL